jgi:multiple sugar transport system permease protein
MRESIGKYRSIKLETILVRALSYFILVSLGATMLVPFLWMLSTSLKNLAEAQVYPPRWIPRQILWSNYGEVMTKVPFGRFILNSFNVSVTGVLGQLITCDCTFEPKLPCSSSCWPL